jgi:hypothetical protein
MQPYPPEVEQQMRRFYQSLSEKESFAARNVFGGDMQQSKP